jgi:hypothetical protein
MSGDHYHGRDLLDLLLKHQVGFAEGNIMKYVFRWREKDGVADLVKARDYLEALIVQDRLDQQEKQINELMHMKDPF